MQWCPGLVLGAGVFPEMTDFRPAKSRCRRIFGLMYVSKLESGNLTHWILYLHSWPSISVCKVAHPILKALTSNMSNMSLLISNYILALASVISQHLSWNQVWNHFMKTQEAVFTVRNWSRWNGLNQMIHNFLERISSSAVMPTSYANVC